MTADDVEGTARSLADRGRDALLERLRPAFREAAQAHADVLQLSDEQIEEMVQSAADRADGLQWRRAIAGVATERLGLSLGEALTHPAVARAQEMLGVPSYEESLAELRARRTGGASSESPVTAAPAESVREPEVAAPEPAAPSAPTSEAPEAEPEAAPEALAPEPGPAEQPTPEPPEPELSAAPLAPDDAEGEPDSALTPALAPGVVRLTVIHLGGIANLEPDEENIELRLSRRGLDVLRAGGDVLGRLAWREIRSLDVSAPRGLGRRRRRGTQLAVRTRQGEALFAVPDLSADQLREQLAPTLERFGPRRR